MSNYNNVNRVLIGSGTNTGAITHISGIKAGDLALIDENNNIIATNTAAAALPRFEKVTIAAGIADGIAILSSPIQGNTVSKVEAVSKVSPAEQVVTLGYNGTASTSIPASADTEYRLRVLIKDSARPNGMRQTIGDVNYTAKDADKAKLAYAVAALFDQKDYGDNYMSDKIKLERVSNGTYGATSGTAAVTVVKGSTKVSKTGITFGAVGVTGFVRIGGNTASDPIYGYTVDATDSIKLDVAYKGESATLAHGLVKFIASTGTVPTEFGFKLTALSINSNVNRAANEPFDQYEFINFEAVFSTTDDLASGQEVATTTNSVIGNPGQGYWKQVADREEAAKGYFGDTSKRRFYDKRINSVVAVGTEYDSIVITHADVQGGDFQGQYTAPLQTEIFIPNGGNQGLNSGNNFVHCLNGFFNTTLGFDAISF
jgi:hypothetical protein